MKTFLKILVFTGGVLLLCFVLLYRSDIPVEKLTPKYKSENSIFIKVRDMDVHVKIRGEGEAIFLIHGSFSSLHTWESWENELSLYFMTISIDLPGHGLTGPDPLKRYSIEDYAALVFEVASQLGIQEFHIAGNSMGGEVALAMSVQAPERILSLNLINAAGAPGVTRDSTELRSNTSRPFIFSLAENKIFGNMLLKCTPRFLFKINLKQVYANDELISSDQVDRYYELLRREGNRKATLERISQRVRRNYDFSSLNMPVLIMWGQEDKWISVKNASIFKGVIPSAKVKIYPLLGHVPMEENPTETVLDYLAFLGIQTDVDYFSTPKYYSYGYLSSHSAFITFTYRTLHLDYHQAF
jgi:pimeloyl-ACP methyl ester carboxylesterase